MIFSRAILILVLSLSLGGLAWAADDGLAGKVGQQCSVHTRNDVYAPANSSKYSEVINGTLKSATAEWVVLDTGLSELWFPKAVIYYVEVKNSAK